MSENPKGKGKIEKISKKFYISEKIYILAPAFQ